LAKGGQLPPAILSLFEANQTAIRALDFIALPNLAKAISAPSTGSTQGIDTTETVQ